jgi:hypothetical protein
MFLCNVHFSIPPISVTRILLDALFITGINPFLDSDTVRIFPAKHPSVTTRRSARALWAPPVIVSTKGGAEESAAAPPEIASARSDL